MKMLMLKVNNVALYLVTCILAGTGLLLEFRLEEDGDRVLGLSGDDWGEFHLILAFIFLGLSALHVLLNWNWVVSLFRGNKKRATAITGLAGMALCVGILLLPGSSSGEHKDGRPAQRHVGDDD